MYVDQYGVPRPRTPDVPRMPNGNYPRAKGAPAAKKDASVLFTEELRHFSSNIAKDCDDAFRSSLIEDESIAGSLADLDKRKREGTPFSLTLDGSSEATMVSEGIKSPWDSRPLPPLPSENTLGSPPAAASTPASYHAVSRDGDDAVYRTAVPILLSKQVERRVVSAPAHSQSTRKTSMLPAINENGGANAANYDKARIVSAPPHTPKKPKQRNGSLEYLSQAENTIRVVHSPTDPSPVKAPAPLNVRKKTVTKSVGRNLHEHFAYDGEVRNGLARESSMQNPPDTKKKKSSWFKRSSKTESENGAPMVDMQHTQSSVSLQGRQRSDSLTSATGATKKKSFSFPFWKSNKNRDSVMSIGEEQEDVADGRQSRQANRRAVEKRTQPAWHKSGSDSSSRNIEVKQNWLARLFRVKPATSHLCMEISRKRARQEVAILLREWRRYGIKGIQVDKQRNIVFARLGPQNCKNPLPAPGSRQALTATIDLKLKEVAFAAEVMTVIEHGKKQPLSIVRFTQERGAASSFEKVVETMRAIFEARNLVVSDKSKQKMMIKTLNA